MTADATHGRTDREEQVTVRRLLKHPMVAVAHDLEERSQRMVREQQGNDFDQWLTDATERSIPELANFAVGL